MGPVSFSVAAGETLGLVGLRGAGHHTIGRAIFGEMPAAVGTDLLLDGGDDRAESPAEAMAHGIGFVSSRRAEEGIAANLAVRENIYLNPVATGKGVLEFVPSAEELARARRREPLFHQGRERRGARGDHVRRQSAESRWSPAGWRREARLLILEEPTIGVDVGAKADIYHLLQLSLSQGLAVLLISSDFEEVERICHRALVFSRGRVVAEIPRERLTVAALTQMPRADAAERSPGATP